MEVSFPNKFSKRTRSYLDLDSPRSAPGSNSARTRPAWSSARSRRFRVVWRTWHGSCCRAALPPLATTRRVLASWRRYTGSCRAVPRKSKLADNPREAAAVVRWSRHRWCSCNNRCWCTRSVRRCCTRTSSRNAPRSGSPFFVNYLPRFSMKKKDTVDPTSAY